MNRDAETPEFGGSRAAGVLLHPTSLPGRYGVGELGGEALRFVEFMRDAGQRLWQVLPLNPVDEAGSPYSSPSAFAGNPLLVSTDGLLSDGLLRSEEVRSVEDEGSVDYASLAPKKDRLLRKAFSRWKPGRDFEAFREENRGWLSDYALFMSLSGKFGSAAWNGWPEDLAWRVPSALKKASERLEGEIRFHEFVQYRFARDWSAVRKSANAAGISIIGDIPIFISHESVDVWANREAFYLDDNGGPIVVAGVPPDYFSETGQLWNNPLYRWDVMKRDDYGWWVARVRRALELCDALRLDHFRGFEAYWEIPAGDETAANGRWIKGPGADLFDALRSELGKLPLIAEDLGDITDEVRELRRKVGLPGMKILQFGFSHPENPFLPHNYEDENWISYTGTHDNDTTAGWWQTSSPEVREMAREYLGEEYVTPADFVRLVHSSRAMWSVIPMQDVLGLDSEARMNEPGRATGNWTWRLDELPDEETAAWLRSMSRAYGRSG